MGNQSSTHGEAVPIIAIKQEVEEQLELGSTPGAGSVEEATASIVPSEREGGPGGSSAEPPEGHQPLLRELADYRLEKKVLGEGAFAKVRLATSEKSGQSVAVKIIKRKKLNQRTEELLQREVKHHERLRHPNIVRLRCSIMTPTKYYLVMEFCPRGDLLQFVNTSGWLKDELARSLFRGLMEGINFCHKLGICHRDLKLENIMLTGEEPAPPSVKIADFGLSVLQATPQHHSVTFCGSPLYAAPELMTDGAAPDGYDASRSDVWSCGVILYALLCSALPFDADEIHSLVRLIQLGTPCSPVPEVRGEDAIDLVSLALTVDAKQRPTAEAILRHAWLQDKQQQQSNNIRPTQSTMALPSQAAAAAPLVSPSGERRRGTSETTAFFRAMMLEEHEQAPPGGAAGGLAPDKAMGPPPQERDELVAAEAAAKPAPAAAAAAAVTAPPPEQHKSMEAQGAPSRQGSESSDAARRQGQRISAAEREEIRAEREKIRAEREEQAKREKEADPES